MTIHVNYDMPESFMPPVKQHKLEFCLCKVPRKDYILGEMCVLATWFFSWSVTRHAMIDLGDIFVKNRDDAEIRDSFILKSITSHKCKSTIQNLRQPRQRSHLCINYPIYTSPYRIIFISPPPSPCNTSASRCIRHRTRPKLGEVYDEKC